MTNPFEDEERQYLVLVNGESQYSVWPSDLRIPAGWEPVLTGASLRECEQYVNETWKDLRPASLVAAMEKDPHRTLTEAPDAE
jgi:MbtH protein